MSPEIAWFQHQESWWLSQLTVFNANIEQAVFAVEHTGIGEQCIYVFVFHSLCILNRDPFANAHSNW